jgi:hypothetical protein
VKNKRQHARRKKDESRRKKREIRNKKEEVSPVHLMRRITVCHSADLDSIPRQDEIVFWINSAIF